MNACDFDAVVYDGAVYCTGCLPEGVTEDSEEVHPAFADSEWDHYPVCDACGERHTYVNLTADGRRNELSHGHMRPVVQYGDWLEVDGDYGTEFIPAELAPDILAGVTDTLTDDVDDFADRIQELEDYLESRNVYSVERTEGYGARMSAPGYMDATEWSVFDTEIEAWDHLWEQHGD